MGKLTISMVIFHSYVPEGRGLMLSNDTYFTYYPMIHGYIIYVQMVDMWNHWDDTWEQYIDSIPWLDDS